MTAKKPSEKSASRTTKPSRTASKKKAGQKRSSPSMYSKAKHMVGAVLMGAATGAVTGAVKGAVEAGGNEMGIPKESEKKESSPKATAKKPRPTERS
jgi:hypothetical protein